MTTNRGHHQTIRNAANFLYQEGKFDEAEREIQRLPESLSFLPSNLHLKAQLALLRNETASATALLEQAILSCKHAPQLTKQLQSSLAIALYRQNKLNLAADTLAKIHGRMSPEMKEAKALWGQFDDSEAYQITGPVSEQLNLSDCHQRPTVEVFIEDQGPYLFQLDTGHPDLVISEELAKSIEQPKNANHCKISQLRLGETSIQNIPCHIRAMPAETDDPVEYSLHIQGKIGLTLLKHLHARIDAKNKLLTIARDGESRQENETPLEASLHQVDIPLWMAGTHHLFTWGSANYSRLLLLNLDTGSTQGMFSAGNDILHKIRAPLDRQQTSDGFPLHYLSLGAGDHHVIVENPTGTRSPVKHPITNGHLGFKVAGIISQECFNEHVMQIDLDSMKLRLNPAIVAEQLPDAKAEASNERLHEQALRWIGQWVPGRRAEEPI